MPRRNPHAMAFLQKLSQRNLQAKSKQEAEIRNVVSVCVGGFLTECEKAADQGKLAHEKYLGSLRSFLTSAFGFSHRWWDDDATTDFYSQFCRFLKEDLVKGFGDAVELYFYDINNSRLNHSQVTRANASGLKFHMRAKWPAHAAQASQPQHVRSNVDKDCVVCLEKGSVVALTPCGHMVCTGCCANFPVGSACPVCRQRVAGVQNLFA